MICIGAGPTGLACAIEAKRAGMTALVIDKGCLCNSLQHYPTNMLFFTTPERMEIGDLPMTTAGGKPTRAEALKYYRRAVEHYGVDTRLYETVGQIEGAEGDFIVHTRAAHGTTTHTYRARKIVIATGYYDMRNHPHPAKGSACVSLFHDAHPYWSQDVVAIGGKNSAGGRVRNSSRGRARDLVHRDTELGKNLNIGSSPISSTASAGEIGALPDSRHAHRAGAGVGEEFVEPLKPSRLCSVLP